MHHFKFIDFRKELTHPIFFTEKDKTWCIIKDSILETPSSNPVEADTRIIIKAVKFDGHVIVKAAHTNDYLVSMRYAHNHEIKTNQ